MIEYRRNRVHFGATFSWWSDLWEKLKELVTVYPEPIPVPIPIPVDPRYRPRH